MSMAKCIVINARSIVNKIDDLRLLTDTNDLHFVFITESWLHEYIPNSLVFDCDKYNVFRKDRSISRGGGVCTLIDKRYTAMMVTIDEVSNLEILAVDVNFKESPIRYRIILCYRPPGYSINDINYFDKFLSQLNVLCDTDCTTVLVGDFNLPYISWLDTPCVIKSDNFHSTFFDFIMQNGFAQFFLENTRANNILDLVFANDPLIIHDCFTCSPLGQSDHDTVMFNLSLPHAVVDSSDTIDDVQYTYDFKNADFESLSMFISTINWDEIFTESKDANECLELFMNVLNCGFDQFVPVKRVSHIKRISTLYPLHVRKLQRKKCSAWRRYKQYSTEPLKEKYKFLKKKCDEAIAKFMRDKEERLISNGNLGSFYRYVNDKLTFKSGVSVLKDANGVLLSDDLAKAERLGEYFSSVFTDDNGILPHVNKQVNDNTALNNVDFTPDLVYKQLHTLDSKTSSSPDLLPALLFKNLAGSLAFPLSLLFSKMFELRALPDIWKIAVVTPIYKKGSASDPANYRPISLTCILCKVMESVIKEAMLAYMLKQGLINKQQHGFICKRSTCSQLLECVNDWSLSLNHKQSVDVAYIDFRRAFDSVVHSKLYFKLQSMGISGTLLDWIQEFLSGSQGGQLYFKIVLQS
jgi:hypothetical protein